MSAAAWRVRALSAVLWVLVAMGPILGAAALLRPTAAPATTSAADVPMGVEGLAELAVHAHLTTLPGESATWLSPGLPALRVTASALEGLSGEEQAAAGRAIDRPVTGVAAIEVRPAGRGRWGVTVAVMRTAHQVEAWQVTVARTSDGLLVETLPALVGLPVGGSPPLPAIPALRPPEEDDPLATAVRGFLGALLTGEGELSRYLATGTDLATPAPTGRALRLQRLAARPLDERRVAALAEVRLVREDGAVHVLHYPLLLQPAGGRWEVVGLLPALPLHPAPEGGPSPP